MCGRYALFSSAERLAAFYGIPGIVGGGWSPRFNVAPGQVIPIIVGGGGRVREVACAVWGWPRGGDASRPLINARSETAASLPMFRSSFAARRCVVPADAFYEWSSAEAGHGQRMPVAVRRRDHEPISLGAIWTPGERDGDPVHVVVLTAASRLGGRAIASVHDRAPVQIPREALDAWLGPSRLDAQDQVRLLRPGADADIVVTPVSTHVNDPDHDDAACLAPREVPRGGGDSLFDSR